MCNNIQFTTVRRGRTAEFSDFPVNLIRFELKIERKNILLSSRYEKKFRFFSVRRISIFGHTKRPNQITVFVIFFRAASIAASESSRKSARGECVLYLIIHSFTTPPGRRASRNNIQKAAQIRRVNKCLKFFFSRRAANE